MKKLLFVLLCLLAAWPAFAEPRYPDKPVAALRILSDAEIGQRLSNVSVGAKCCDQEEQFYADGTYVRFGYSKVFGHYVVRSNLVCVIPQGQAEHCHILFTDGDDNTYAAKSGSIMASYLEIRPLDL